MPPVPVHFIQKKKEKNTQKLFIFSCSHARFVEDLEVIAAQENAFILTQPLQ